MQLVPLIDRLEQQLQSIENQVVDMLDASTIEKRPHDPFRIAIINDYYWGKTDENQQRVQLKLLRKYLSWYEQFQMLFYNSPEMLQAEIIIAHSEIRELIEKKNGSYVPSTIDQAKKTLLEHMQTYYRLLGLFKSSNNPIIILVPDTNALIKAPELSSYAAVVERAEYTVVILPTVLSELDKLKITHRNEEFRGRIESVIRRLKGLRQQGNMQEGVTVNRTVTVKMIAKEPDFKRTLSWLDPENNDDRIIAATLEVQRDEPSNIVILVSADINHQNKAEMANIPFVEPPDTSAS